MQNTKISLLFWNIRNNKPVEALRRLVQKHAVDILLLAESPFVSDGKDLLDALNSVPEEPKFSVVTPDAEKRVQVFSRLPNAIWTRKATHARYSLWEVSCPYRFLLATAHFPEIQYQQGDEQRECSVALRLDLEKAEGDWEDPVSIVVGDLNAAPYEAGISSVYGLNATPSRRLAENVVREYNGRKYPYLFNPMWRFLADSKPGTYYNSGISAPIRQDWYLLDQVLVRPAILRMFDTTNKNDLQILTSDGLSSLLNNSGIPEKDISDHLPLFFRIHLPGD